LSTMRPAWCLPARRHHDCCDEEEVGDGVGDHKGV
jgi:hypothetical protein